MRMTIKCFCCMAVCAGVIASAGCERTNSAVAEQPPESAETDDSEKGSDANAAKESGDEITGKANSADGETGKTDLPRFTFRGTPHDEELHTLKMTAKKKTKLPLHAKPNESAKVVDYLDVSKGTEIKRSGRSRMIISPEIRSAPKAFTLSAESHESGPKPEGAVNVKKGDEFAIEGSYIGEGTYACYVWYKGSMFSECPAWSYAFPSTTVQVGGDDIPTLKIGDFKGKANGWWVEVDGPTTKGWLRADRDEVVTESEVMEGYR